MRFDCRPHEALALLHGWGGRPLPLNASAWWNGSLIVRLRGSRAAVAEGERALGGEPIAADRRDAVLGRPARPDRSVLRRRRRGDRAQDATLWRLSLPQTAPLLGLAGDELIEWHGAQRWLATALPAAQVRDAAAGVGGHATAFRSRDKSIEAFAPLSAPLRAIHERLKRSFDPKGIFNPGRLYPGL